MIEHVPAEHDGSADTTTDPTTIRAQAIKLLARREHARAELVAKLVARAFDRDASAAVVDDLAAEGLQSELRYAEAMVRDRVRRGIGPIRIRADLAAAGCEAETAEQAIADGEAQWIDVAASARVKRFGDPIPSDIRQRAQQTRFLQRRGFDGETVRAVLGN